MVCQFGFVWLKESWLIRHKQETQVIEFSVKDCFVEDKKLYKKLRSKET